ncbi:uncharacterized protein LOC141584948 [Saimiri boliviensis]|uniref:uncharacterized protein LOC141584948 n=1 Tax=Saimiri boliviensis TaxID=27679 RepID=UPI003D76F96D
MRHQLREELGAGESVSGRSNSSYKGCPSDPSGPPPGRVLASLPNPLAKEQDLQGAQVLPAVRRYSHQGPLRTDDKERGFLSRRERGPGVRENPLGAGGSGAPSPPVIPASSRGLGRARASLGAGRRWAGPRESTPPPAPGPPRAARPPAWEPLSWAWPVRVRLLDLGTTSRLGTGLVGGAHLGLGGPGFRSRPRPRDPAVRTPSPASAARCSSAGQGQVPPSRLASFLYPRPPPTPVPAETQAVPSLRGVAGCGADSVPAATLPKLSGSGTSSGRRSPGGRTVEPEEPALLPHSNLEHLTFGCWRGPAGGWLDSCGAARASCLETSAALPGSWLCLWNPEVSTSDAC